jgi:hypothetical protein
MTQRLKWPVALWLLWSTSTQSFACDARVSDIVPSEACVVLYRVSMASIGCEAGDDSRAIDRRGSQVNLGDDRSGVVLC